jgi:hypothetical protein
MFSVTSLLRSRRGWFVACALTFGAPVIAADDQPVALPPFLVEELAKGPPWRYGTRDGYEVLSRCNDATTRRVLETHQQLHVLLAEMLPPNLQYKTSVPRTLILYDEELQPAASKEVIARMLRPTVDVAVENEPGFGGLRGMRGPAAARPSVSFLPNLRLWDRDALALFMIVRRDDFDTDRLSLTPDYISFILQNRLPALPGWFVAGLLTLYRQTTFARGELVVAELEWHGAPVVPVAKDQPPPPPALLLTDLFGGRPTSRPADPPTMEPLKAWQSQAALFVRWGTDPADLTRRAAFWSFVERCAVEGASEKLFIQCFGFDYAAAQKHLTAYLPVATRRPLHLRPRQAVKFPLLALRNASDGEIAGIKGDWERLEVPYVRMLSPDLAPKYLEQARRTLKRAYDRDVRDPRLLAVMGLCECDAANPVGAREYLEAAVQLGPVRPRANYELARLRLAEFRAAPAAANGRLATGQMAEVLQPLFRARADPPPLPEVYELIAEVWLQGAATPTRGHLAVLDEGVKLFPRRTALVLAAAELNLRHGYKAEAHALADIAVRFAPDETTRARAIALGLAAAP